MVLDSLKKVGSRFAFECFLEVWKPKLVESLRKWLEQYSVEDINRMVSQGQFPDVSKLDLSVVKDYLEYIDKISIERLIEDFLGPARPDLIQAIIEMGMPGANWLVKLRLELLEKVRKGQKPADIVKEDTVLATCDACGKSWPVARSDFDKVKECPFCHHGKDEPPPTLPQHLDNSPGIVP
jgi:hypothetical protein